jgi:hypothetical protein
MAAPDALETGRPVKIGKRFTKVKAVEFSDGTQHQEIDREMHATREQMRARSIRILEDAGIPVSESLEDAPGGSMLRDLVLNSLDHPADSALGLAARIVELCNRLDWYEAEGAPLRVVIPAALLLGRLDALAKVYRVTEDTTAPELQKGPEARRKYTKAKRDEWVKVWREMKARNPSLTPNGASPEIAKRCNRDGKGARSIREHLDSLKK